MHNTRAGLIILLLGAPHILKRTQRRQDGASYPHRVLAFRWGDDLDLHRARRQCCELLLHAVGDAGEHRRATGEYDIAVEVAADIKIAFEDRVVRRFVDACRFESEEGWLEECLGSAEASRLVSSVRTRLSDGDTDRSLPMVITCPSGSS